jgi:membrane-associated phospholipid phosphatase
MNVLVDTIQRIQSVDVVIYHVLNGFAGNRWLDYFASFEENDNLLKGGLFVAMYWYLWFRAGPDQDKRRRAIIAIVVGTLLALVASRMVADLTPFRIRPMYNLNLQHLPYSFPVSPKLVNWSAFPSDTATFFFGLSFGLAYLSRRLAIPAMLYTAVWICLPRMFLGVHYASDVVVGAVIGTALVWASLKTARLQSGLGARLLSFVDTKPEVFYAGAFLASFEMGVLFDDVRTAASAVVHGANVGNRGFIHTGLVAIASLGLLGLAAYFVFLGRKRSSSPRAASCLSHQFPFSAAKRPHHNR